MKTTELKKNIFFVGASHPERRMFDELIPLPDGTSYNSYLVKGSEKTALLDTVDPAREKELLENLRSLKIERIDYVIAHHGEQDHSGSIPTVLAIYKDAKVVTNQKCKELLKTHLLIPEDKFITVADRETLSLGDKTLEFVFTPWVHWPETMVTYLKEAQILFSCDFFGAHLALNDVFVTDEAKVYPAAKRYFAEIMMPFRNNIETNLAKLKELKIKIIAPSHGPVHNRPAFILTAYNDWISDQVKNEVVIPYVSMHGSTAKMVEHLVAALENKGVVVKPFNLGDLDLGGLAMALVDAATIVVGTPTVLTGPHPKAVYAVYLANALRPKTRFISVVGSFGWGGRMLDVLTGMVTNIKAEVIDPVVIKGVPDKEGFKLLDKLADEIAKKHQASELVK